MKLFRRDFLHLAAAVAALLAVSQPPPLALRQRLDQR
jgi:hypothetical protein